MLKIEAVIQPHKLDDVKAALARAGVEAFTLYQVLDHGPSLGHQSRYRGHEYRADESRVKLEMLVGSNQAEEVTDAIFHAARTNFRSDDGIITVYEVADAIRIHSGERLQYASL